MKKHIAFISISFGMIVAILLGTVGYKIYHTPRPVDTPAFPVSFTMTKLDPDGTERSSCEITITGTKLEYLSGITCLDVEVTGLPVQRTIRALKYDDGIVGEIRSFPYWEIQRVDCREWPDGGFAHLLFSPDYERWAISYSTNDPFYVGSVDNKYTVQGLYEYFGDYCVNPWPYERTPKEDTRGC